MEENTNKRKGKPVSRREALKSLATIPVIGAVAYGVYKKKSYERFMRSSISEELGMSQETPAPVVVSAEVAK
jgi:hypothetical protein